MLSTHQVRFIAKPVAFIALVAPFAWLVIRGLGLGSGDLGPNPIETVLETLGKTGLNLIFITLAITPLRRLTGWQWLVRLRRMLGLGSFYYLALHLLTYVVLDQGLDWPTLIEDVVDRPFVTVGFAGVLLLIPLALTSTNGWRRRLGQHWRTLHQLVYVVAVLGAIHFYWQTKRDLTEPVIYIALLGVLLGSRLWFWWRARASRLENRRGDGDSDSRSTIDRPKTPNPA